MISRTKFEIDEPTILRLFAQAGISGVLSAKPLGDGEFNAVYLAHAEAKDYVLKIAPRADAPAPQARHPTALDAKRRDTSPE